MQYVEGTRSLHLYSEVLAKPWSVAIWRDTIKRWDPPHEANIIGQDDRERIIGNIQRAFEAVNQTLEVV
jgi:hypothetical protein